MKIQSLLLFIMIGITSCNNSTEAAYSLSERMPQIDKTRDVKIMSAFFGLDNALPKSAIGI